MSYRVLYEKCKKNKSKNSVLTLFGLCFLIFVNVREGIQAVKFSTKILHGKFIEQGNTLLLSKLLPHY